MQYTANTESDIKEMLSDIGVQSIAELFSPIPKELRAQSFNLQAGKSEFEVIHYLKALANKNSSVFPCFIGAGIYDHYIPAVVDSLSGRAEFYTAYTPYQPECSQGTLQALFEYQTAICSLTGMDISNASLYDGGSGVAEAALMAIRITDRHKIFVDKALNPFYRTVLDSYLANRDIEIVSIELEKDILSKKDLQAKLDDQAAAVIVQNPNFFGGLRDLSDISEMAHNKGALLIAAVYPISLGLIETPGQMGADIVTGEGQSLGNPMSFGGPGFGFIATKREYVRQLPGRIIGETVDKEGRRGYVLTLQTREQHIKRQKATSNICSNQSLCALRAGIFLSALGKNGFTELSRQNYDKAEYAKSILGKIKGVSLWNNSPTFNEFVIELPKNSTEVSKKLLNQSVAAGLPLDNFFQGMENCLLVAVTEKRSRSEIDLLAKTLEETLWK